MTTEPWTASSSSCTRSKPDKFTFPLVTHRQTRDFVRLLNRKGFDYDMLAEEVGEKTSYFQKWRLGSDDSNEVGDRVMRRLNRPLQDAMLSDDEGDDVTGDKVKQLFSGESVDVDDVDAALAAIDEKRRKRIAEAASKIRKASLTGGKEGTKSEADKVAAKDSVVADDTKELVVPDAKKESLVVADAKKEAVLADGVADKKDKVVGDGKKDVTVLDGVGPKKADDSVKKFDFTALKEKDAKVEASRVKASCVEKSEKEKLTQKVSDTTDKKSVGEKSGPSSEQSPKVQEGKTSAISSEKTAPVDKQVPISANKPISTADSGGKVEQPKVNSSNKSEPVCEPKDNSSSKEKPSVQKEPAKSDDSKASTATS